MLKISIIGALIGVVILYIISDNIKLDETSISKIEDDDIGSDVKVMGVVSDVFNSDKVSILTITQPADMKVVVMENISVSVGDYIEVIGEIDEYEGEKEVIGNRVRVID